ncbi:c-type cytochrome [Cocleimonas flava]|uniref:Cytochrome c553 n=1 Tax=Cocleimonas flava TaxID=634765 RepID=A0A4R1ESS7_9GAMM|nr:c-type cytochrome [Cocleimonas flava]TCJ82824.1 cytochrome c553 [Cocleimonas flava]
MKIVVMLGLVATLSFNLTASANEAERKADAANGKAVSGTCAACHGADGNSVNPDWPKIAGQGEAYLAKQLHDFRSDKRVDPSMTAMAKAIKSDDDVADLAAYFSSVKAKPGVAKPDMIAKGEAIYKGGVVSSGVAACAACHGPTGSGNPAAKFPKISGQHAKYTVTQLMNFKTSKRANDTGKMMRNVALKMTDAEMNAVAEYISGLRD